MRSSFTAIGVAAFGFTACGGSRATVDPFSSAERSTLTDALTTAFCGALHACCDRAAMAHDADACAARVRPVYSRYVEYMRGRVAYHPDRLGACQDAIRAGVAACRPRSIANDARNTLLPHPCEELLEERPPPVACSSSADCAAGGECQPHIDYEARRTYMSCSYGLRPFDGEIQTCAPGMELTGGVCIEATNIGDRALGAACTPDVAGRFDDPCAAGSYCDGTSGSCAADKSVGAPCGAHIYGEDGRRRECGFGAACTGGVCEAAPRALYDDITVETCAHGPDFPP